MLLVVISFPLGLFPLILAKGQEAALSASFWFGLFPGALGFEGRALTFPPPSGCCAGEIWPGGSQKRGRLPGLEPRPLPVCGRGSGPLTLRAEKQRREEVACTFQGAK